MRNKFMFSMLSLMRMCMIFSLLNVAFLLGIFTCISRMDNESCTWVATNPEVSIEQQQPEQMLWSL